MIQRLPAHLPQCVGGTRTQVLMNSAVCTQPYPALCLCSPHVAAHLFAGGSSVCHTATLLSPETVPGFASWARELMRCYSR